MFGSKSRLYDLSGGFDAVPLHPIGAGTGYGLMWIEEVQMAGQPWSKSFEVDGEPGGEIGLRQVGRKTFELTSKLYYRGKTGLEDTALTPDQLEDIKTLDASPESPYETDLASVPGALRWFLGAYGSHTPAVLIHDRMIPVPEHLKPNMTEQYSDRFLRFMLQDLEMRWLKRWIMWAGVALRTRWAAGDWRRVSVVLWVVTALAGMTAFVIALRSGNTGLLWLSLLAPFVLAGLWGRQYGAGVVAAIAAPWLLPPTVLAIVGYGIYIALEFALGWAYGLFAGEEARGSGTYKAEGL
jgi:hypothetical protein